MNHWTPDHERLYQSLDEIATIIERSHQGLKELLVLGDAVAPHRPLLRAVSVQLFVAVGLLCDLSIEMHADRPQDLEGSFLTSGWDGW